MCVCGGGHECSTRLNIPLIHRNYVWRYFSAITNLPTNAYTSTHYTVHGPETHTCAFFAAILRSLQISACVCTSSEL